MGTRATSSLVLVGSFVTIIAKYRQAGCAGLVAFLQWALFREGMAIVRDEVCEVLLESQKNGARALRRTQWAVFWVLELALYGRLLAKEISAVTEPSPWMSIFCRCHPPACAALYVAVLLSFISSLKSPQLIMYQLGQYTAAHFACFLILPSALVSFASRAGLIWFVLPSASVIVNDIMAYICGRLFGQTPLTVLSPKKTREGFVGAALCTSVVGWLMGRWFGEFHWMISPQNVFLQGHDTGIEAADMFEPTVDVGGLDIVLSRAEIHGFWIALMASLIGPFGGFIASGIKRAYGIKDFGNSIPGHGGAGDRFDCQVMLLPLVYFYLKAFAPGFDI